MPETTLNSLDSNKDLNKYFVAFSRINKIGPRRLERLLAYFPDIKAAWHANLADLLAAGIDENTAHEIVILKNEINPDEQWERLLTEGIRTVTIADEDYPPLLREIYEAPYLLYYRGSLEALKNFCLAVVGSRKHTAYGERAVAEIVADLARSGITIVSGLALGIDALAHAATLGNQGKTVAVLGSGVDWQNVYPSANRYLAKKIIDSGGAVITDFCLGTPPGKHTFPYRNRIISGLSLGVLVIEAGESSGSLITAKFALEQNRQVFAVPGSIFNLYSVGTNNLIRQGAFPVTKAADVLEALNLQQIEQFIDNRQLIPASADEAMILKNLTKEPLHIDKISQLCKIKINVLSGQLLLMEMKGMIKNVGGQCYVLLH